MNNDQINELPALMGPQIKENAELRIDTNRRFEESDRRFAQLTEVMVNGFLHLEDRLGARIDKVSDRPDGVVERLDGVVERLDTVTDEVREVRGNLVETNRRLANTANTFDHVGRLTEQTDASQLRPARVEEAQQPTNAEPDAPLRAVEEQLRNAS